MSTILRYVLSDRDGNEGDVEYDSFFEAKEYAIRYGNAVIEREYEFTDSSLIWTPDGSETWPPTNVLTERPCAKCGDEVLTLSSRDWCDGCEAEEAANVVLNNPAMLADALRNTQALNDEAEKKWCPTCCEYETSQQTVARHYR